MQDTEAALQKLVMQNEGPEKGNNIEPKFHFLAHKAGMQNVDKEKVAKIITEASRDSRFYNKQMEKKEKVEQQVTAMKEKIDKFWKDKQYVQSVQKIVEKKLNDIEKERILTRTWVNFDMDMFYVACEIRDNPSLKDKPVAVGGMSMISTANYVARQFGVRSAMPGFIAKKLCPELILIGGNFQKYEETSRKFKDILQVYDPEFESGGLDEASVDLTNYINENGISSDEEIEKLCHDIRMKINTATGVTCSCGIGPNKMLAKLSTEINKPNGQFLMKSNKEVIMDFLSKLTVRKIPGIGSQSEQLLNGLGIATCSDILSRSTELYVAFTENSFEFFIRSALGIARCYHEFYEDRKSISVSRTFPVISKVEDMEKKLGELAGMLSDDLKHYKKKANHITVIIKTHNFDVKNHGGQTEKFIDDAKEILQFSLKMFKELLPLDPLRLMGIRASQLTNIESKTLDKFFQAMTAKPNNDIKMELDKQGDVNVTVPKIDFKPIESKQPTKVMVKSNNQSKPEELKKTVSNETNNETNLKTDSIKPVEIVCPICNKKFDSIVNMTRINKHIDQCLISGNANMENSTSNMAIENEPSTRDEVSRSSLLKDDNRILHINVPNKRKAEEESKDKNGTKKNKKNPETNNNLKLDSFFKKGK